MTPPLPSTQEDDDMKLHVTFDVRTARLIGRSTTGAEVALPFCSIEEEQGIKFRADERKGFKRGDFATFDVIVIETEHGSIFALTLHEPIRLQIGDTATVVLGRAAFGELRSGYWQAR